MKEHVPVLLEQVIRLAAEVSPRVVLDGTVGYGGHASALLARIPSVRLLVGLDVDEEALAAARRRLTACPRVRSGEAGFVLLHASYADEAAVDGVLERCGGEPPDFILLDLGASTPQLTSSERGFSLFCDAPPDMRMNRASSAPTALELLRSCSSDELAALLRDYGEVRRPRRLAGYILAHLDEIGTCRELAAVVERFHRRLRGASGGGRRVHPATRVFQALRIAVNGELHNVERGVPMLFERLRPGGRMAVISFHSLEDGIVKRVFRRLCSDCICDRSLPVCTCGHRREARYASALVRPSPDEVERNPAARSARMRVVEKLGSADYIASRNPACGDGGFGR